MVGKTLGHYEILEPLGVGGMGQVYRAHDQSLKRDVAIKVIHEGLASDPDRLARLEREAHSLAALNHPNVATIHGFHEVEGVRFLALELIEGSTLSDRLRHGGIDIDDALDVACQIAEALQAAHDAGIVHRDLKPANIKITPQGRVKVLDFGLAKPTHSAAEPGEGLTHSPTATVAGTGAGILLGTAPYMSPEQARGRPVDRRTDIWAFGCVLFEMLSGHRPFAGEDVTEIIASIVKEEPAWERLPDAVPSVVRSVLRRCLRKDPDRRLHDIADARIEIEEVVAPSGDEEAEITRSVARVDPFRLWMRRLALLATVAAALVLGHLSGSQFSRPVPATVERFVVTAAPAVAAATVGNTTDLAISHDGTRVVYRSAQGGGLYMRPVGELEGALVRGTDGGRAPFFSPDGESLGFYSAARRALMRVPVSGGAPTVICPLDSELRGASWGADDVIVFAEFARGELFTVSASGGNREVLTEPDVEVGEISHRWPHLLPGGDALLYTSARGGRTQDRSIVLLNLSSKARTTLIDVGSNPQYSPSGHIVFGLQGTLRAVAFDPGRGAVVGDPVRVLDGLMTKSGTRGRGGRQDGAANFALADNGSLAYIPSEVTAPQRSLVWVDRQGKQDVMPIEPYAYRDLEFSPDGTVLALDRRDEENDIWMWDVENSGPLTRLTFDPTPDFRPRWITDARVAFSSRRAGPAQLFAKSADGSGGVEQLTDLPFDVYMHDVASDGAFAVWGAIRPDTRGDIGMTELDGERADVSDLLATEANEEFAMVSPDGRWIAYQSDGSGLNEIYVEPFPEVGSGRWEVSTNGGTDVRWSRHGDEIFYRASNGSIMAVPVVADGATLRVGRAEAFLAADDLPGGVVAFDVHPDGDRVLVIRGDPVAEVRRGAADIVLVRNWVEELQQSVPGGRD